jgi:prepilin-type N-terminal cleavage/methylation domain-containing protein
MTMQGQMQTENRRRQSGYNIVEVLIAMALLGVVTVSIVTLFFMGRRNVYAGKQMTKAISVGTRIEEDMSAMTLDDVLTNFGMTTTAATTTSSATVAGTTYTNCLLRDTNTINGTTDPNGWLTKWKALLPAAEITSPKITFVFMPRAVTRTVAGTSTTFPETTPTFPDVPILRMRIVIEWKEGARARSIVMDNVKNKRI